MSIFKRMVSCVMVLAMIAAASVFTLPVFAADDNDTAATFVADEKDVVISEKLSIFGVVDTVDEAELTNFVKRSDMIPLLLKYLGMEGAAVNSDTTPFLDVSVFDEQIAGYSVLYKSGYISGDENKMYHPNDFLTYNEAITMIVNAMGYKPFADRNGGYPSGYLYTANKYELLSGLRGKGTDYIPWCDLYSIIEASLDADAVVTRTFDADGYSEFALQKDVTVLEEIYKIKTITGIVTGNENTRLLSAGSELIGRYQIEIEDVIYDTPEQEYADLLGYRVKAYAKKNTETGDYEIIYLEQHKKNETFTLSAQDLLIGKTTDSAIYYEDENFKEQHIKVDYANLSVIYNGKARFGYGALKNVLPESGNIVGVDNTGDRAIDVLFVNEFKNFVVGSVDTYSYKLIEKYTKEALVLDELHDDVRIYNKGGNTMKVSDVMAGDVLSVMETENSKGYKLYNVYNYRESLEGSISEITSDGDLVIDGTTYEIAPNLNAYIEDGSKNALKAGDEATFYLDYAGRVAEYDTGSGSVNGTYAFVAATDVKDKMGIELRIKMYTQNKEWIEAKAATKLNIDGYKYDLSKKSDAEVVKTKVPVGEIVIFRMKGSEISYIDTAELNYGSSSAKNDAGNLTLISQGATNTTDYYLNRGGIMFGRGNCEDFIVKNGNVIVFTVPNEGEYLDKLEDYGIRNTLQTGVYYKPSGSYTYKCNGLVAYNTEKKDVNVAKVVLIRGASSSGATEMTRNTDMVVFKEMRTKAALDKNGNKVGKMVYLAGGTESGATVEDYVDYGYTYVGSGTDWKSTEVAIENLKLFPGDIIQFGKNADGNVSSINVVYRANQSGDYAQEAQLNASNSFGPYIDWNNEDRSGGDQAGAAAGIIVDVDYTNNVIAYKNVSTDKTYITNATNNVMIYRSDIEKSESAKAANLMVGDLVIFRSNNGNYNVTPNQIIVLR